MSFVGAKLILTQGANLLTCLRDDFDWLPFPGHWDLPGGQAEPGETPMECALRELDEEFGLRLDPARLAGQIMPSVTRPGRDSWLFVGTLTIDEIASIRFGDEGQEWRMMPISEFVAHPRAVPHFRSHVAQVLGL